MGGIGSGRHWKFGSKDTTNSFRRLDVRRWAREGLLRPGNAFGWEWSRDGEKVASIQVTVEVGNVRLIYKSRQRFEDWRDFNYPVTLNRTPCTYGGSRTWFLCPAHGCGQRAAILYGGAVFACRTCHQLAYPSQNENPIDRAQRRADTLRLRLGWDLGFEGTCRAKPKGMHRRTFDRLSAEIWELEEHVHAAYVTETEALLRQLRPI